MISRRSVVETDGALARELVAGSRSRTRRALWRRLGETAEDSYETGRRCTCAQLRRGGRDDGFEGVDDGFGARAVDVLAVQAAVPVREEATVAHALLVGEVS